MGQRWCPFHSPQPDTSRSRKTTDTGPVHRVVCPFTPQLSLLLINRSRRDGTLSRRWYTAATDRSRTSPAPYHSATAYRLLVYLYVLVLWKQPRFKQTSETASAKRRIRQIITQWVPGSWADNSKCPTPIRAETVSRHNEVMTSGRTKMSYTYSFLLHTRRNWLRVHKPKQ